MEGLSEKQQRILSFLRSYMMERGYPPSIRDICAACHISSTSVADYNLRILEQKGYIRRSPEISRGIELRDGSTERPVRVPVIGQIAAGEPIPVPSADAWQEAESWENITLSQEHLRGRPQVYALRVKGTSMIDALINDGDLVLMEPAPMAENGDMVAVWLKTEKEATLKRIYQEGDRIRLQPANREMAPLYVAPENVEIQGRVIGVLRWID